MPKEPSEILATSAPADPTSSPRGPSRVPLALFGAAAGVLIAGALDAYWARAASANPPEWGATWVAAVGLLAPVGIVVGLGVGFASWFLHPATLPSPKSLARALHPESAAARARLAVALPASMAALVLWLVVVGEAALQSLTSDQGDRAAGVGLGLTAVGWALVFGLVVLGLGEWCAPRLERKPPSPLVTGGVALVGTILVLGLGVAWGDVGGASGPLLMFGVLRREELDLRAPSLILLVALLAYLAPALVPWASRGSSAWARRVPSWIALALGICPLFATVHASGAGLQERKTALAIERSAPAGRLLVKPLRAASDRDGDGVGRSFGGGDCDDTNPNIYPGADDIPENGLDEDCSGTDAEKVVLEQPEPEPPPDAATFIKNAIPEDLSVVVLSIDALRWDTPGFMGNPLNVTPNLDKLAKKGVVFEATYAPASYTGKSIPPMMVGKYGCELNRGWAHFNRIDKRDKLIWERLQEAGVRTLSVQGYWYFFRKGLGFERGWDVLDGSPAPGLGYSEKDESVTSDKIADRTIEVLRDRENTGKRFFFWTHYVDPHADYVKHEGFDFGSKGSDRYRGEVAFTEAQVGRVIDFIQSGDLADRTAIVITSDHGEAFGEHGMIRHGFEIWEPLVRVPLLVYVPGVKPHRVKPRRGLIDLVPTLLELYGMDPPSGEGDDFVSGQSLVPDIVMPPGHEPAERIVFVDMQAGPNNDEKQAFIENDFKLITTYGKPNGLYNLREDPEEANDLLDSDPELSEKVVARFQAFRRELRTVFVKPIPR